MKKLSGKKITKASTDKDFIAYQKKWNEDNVEVDRFQWQTTNKVISAKEKRLLSALNKYRRKSVLEVGCGEGANSVNLHVGKNFTGCDYSKTRIAFAKKHSTGHFVVSDGTKLVFKDNSYDVVFCRDVIHHVRERKKLVSEMYRVCKKGGKVILIESNALNLVNLGFSLLFKKEHDMRKITPKYVKGIMSGFKGGLTIKYSEAYNLDRLFFHYQMGIQSSANLRIFRIMNDGVNMLFEFLLPKFFRAYMIVELTKR